MARDAAPVFPPLLDSRIKAIVRGEPERLQALVTQYGSPLNIVWPHAVAANIAAMRHAFERQGVDHAIYYGAKVNKSQGLLRAAVAAGIGVDVSSLPEFADALRAGLDPSAACATGPAKTAAFHRALIEAGALVAVDSLEELDELAQASPAGTRIRVLLRLRPVSAGASRFGMGADAITTAMRRVAEPDTPFAFEGFHAHLSGYAVEGRAAAIREMADLVDEAGVLGLVATVLDIGGGLPVRYVAPDAYAEALHQQKSSDYRHGKLPAGFYPYGSRSTAAEWIADLLDAPCRGGTVSGYLRDRGLHLAIEPGRSLVDQAAISIFRVTRTKYTGDGTAVIFVEGSGFSACETWFASEFLVDPLFVPAASTPPQGEVLRAYVAGHSCLDEDVITNRLIEFGIAPRPGDLLIYANTAGYQMDLLENEFHRHPMPARLIARFAASGTPTFLRDK